MKAFIVSVASVLFFTGCGTVDFTPYVGAQRAWPTRSGAFVKQVKGVSFYQSWPERPYIVLGHVDVFTHPNYINSQLAWAVKHHKADGVIIMDSSTFQAGSVNTAQVTANSFGATTTATGIGTSVPILRNQTTGYLFRFTTNAPAQ